ncbi:hypothetical protein HN51_010778 [Arachis hypogaea]
MNNMKVPNVPGGGLFALLKVSIFGGLAVYGAANSLYNVEGGHRAIVFNRIVGVKDKVCFIYNHCSIEMFVMCFATCSICSILKRYFVEVFCYEFLALW